MILTLPPLILTLGLPCCPLSELLVFPAKKIISSDCSQQLKFLFDAQIWVLTSGSKQERLLQSNGIKLSSNSPAKGLPTLLCCWIWVFFFCTKMNVGHHFFKQNTAIGHGSFSLIGILSRKKKKKMSFRLKNSSASLKKAVNTFSNPLISSSTLFCSSQDFSSTTTHPHCSEERAMIFFRHTCS